MYITYHKDIQDKNRILYYKKPLKSLNKLELCLILIITTIYFIIDVLYTGIFLLFLFYYHYEC